MRPWNVIGASVAGTKHHRIGAPCEDAWDAFVTENLSFCCVADGAGSARRAADGARVAVAAARNAAFHLRHDFLNVHLAVVVEQALVVAADAIEAMATREGVPLSDFATTLTVAAMRGDEVAVAQVGDCLAVLHCDGKYEVLAHPDRPGRFVDETEFLGATLAREAEATVVCTDLRSGPIELALSSDGLAPLLLDRWHPPIPHDRFFDSLFQATAPMHVSTAQIEDFMTSSAVCDRTDDDKTLVLARRVL